MILPTRFDSSVGGPGLRRGLNVILRRRLGHRLASLRPVIELLLFGASCREALAAEHDRLVGDGHAVLVVGRVLHQRNLEDLLDVLFPLAVVLELLLLGIVFLILQELLDRDQF